MHECGRIHCRDSDHDNHAIARPRLVAAARSVNIDSCALSFFSCRSLPLRGSKRYVFRWGSAPLFVALFASFALGQRPSPFSSLGIVLVSMAISSIAFTWPTNGKGPKRSIAAALITGLIIAAYTAVDAIGLRLAPTPFTYIVWLFILDGSFVMLMVVLARRRTILPFINHHWRPALIAGLLGVLTYGLALIALSMGPVAQIAALRETSILFAALIGTLILGEPFGAKRVIAGVLAVIGIGPNQLG